MAGAFELLAKTADFTELSRTMAATAAQLAKAKAEADKQRRKAEEDAMRRVDDFIISDKNQYTQKYLPYAQQSLAGLIEKVAEDKKNYPNTWTNLVTQRILDTKNQMNWALEQSNTQREIQKQAEEGFMVPEKLLKSFNSNYGDVSDIVSNQEELARYGIIVGADGSIKKDLAKPVNMQREIERVQTQKGRFVEELPTIKTYNADYDFVTETAKIKPEEKELFKSEMIGNKDLRRTYMVNDQKYALVNQEYDALKAKYPQAADAQLVNIALDNVIARDIDTANFDITQTGLRQKGKGTTVIVGDKPRYPTLQELTYTNATIGGSKRAGVDVRQAQIKQGMPETKATRYLNTESKMINPKTGAELDAAKKDAILNSDVYVNDVYNKDGVPTARVSISIPASGVQNIALKGITEFEIPLEKSDDLEQSITATFGDMLTKNGYSSIYDYVKSLKPAGGAAPSPAPAAEPAQQGVKGKSGKTWTKT